MFRLAFFALLLSLVAGDTTETSISSVVGLFLPFHDPQPLVASIIGADSVATTYMFSCSAGVDLNECGIITSETITQGPSTVSSTLTINNDEGALYRNIGCKIVLGDDLAMCTIDITTSNTDGITRYSTVTSTGFKAGLVPATVTAGFEKIMHYSLTTPSYTRQTADSGKDKSLGDSSKQETANSSNAAPAITHQALVAGVAAVMGAVAL